MPKFRARSRSPSLRAKRARRAKRGLVDPIGSADQINASEADLNRIYTTNNITNMKLNITNKKGYDSKLMIVRKGAGWVSAWVDWLGERFDDWLGDRPN